MTDPSPISLARLDRAIADLRAIEREIFFLHRLDGLDYAQIAAHHGISVSDVERHIGNALDALRRAHLRTETRWWQRWLR